MPLVQGTRVDPAHTVGDARPSESDRPDLLDKSSRGAAGLNLEQIEEQIEPVGQTTPVPSWETADDLLPQLRSQADQLASHLRQRQEELDHRESQLNAHLAKLDVERRTACLWFDERQAEHEDQQAALQSRNSELDDRAVRLGESEAELKSTNERIVQQQAELEQAQFNFQLTQAEWEANCKVRQTEQQERQLDLAAWDECLSDRQAAVDTAWQQMVERETFAAAEVERSRQAIERQRSTVTENIHQALENLERRRQIIEARGEEVEARALEIELQAHAAAEKARQPNAEEIARAEELNEIAARLRERESAVAEAEAQLSHSQSELTQWRQRLEQERERLEVQARADRQKVVEQQRRQMADFARQKQALQRRGEQLDHRHSAMQQMRAELAELHRETLEMRFAAEEIWAQLNGSLPAASLTRSLGDIRHRLSDHFRLASAELVEQKAELVRLRDDLAGEHAKLRTQKHELQQWVEDRHQELEQQAERLTLREQDLDGQETQFRNLEQRWVEQRFEYEQQIRRLKSRVGNDTLDDSPFEPATLRRGTILNAAR